MGHQVRMERPEPGRPHEAACLVVLATLTLAIAIPGYSQFVRASRIPEATVRIHQIIAAATLYAQNHPDQLGNPTWPPPTGPWIAELSESSEFRYSVALGSLEDASNSPFRVVATGRPEGSMHGVRVQMTTDRIGGGVGKPQVDGL